MTFVEEQCPSRQSLESFLNESSDAGNAVGVHIRNCPFCQLRLEELCVDADLDVLKGQLSTTLNYDSEAKCVRLVSQLSAMDTLHNEYLQTPHLATLETAPIFSPGVEGDLGAIDHYRVIREIGRGGMSIVYEAIDTRMQRSVAIKVLRPNDNDLTANERFIREAKAIGAISHTNVIAIHHVEVQSGSTAPYLVMELVRGPTLQDWIRDNGIVMPRTAAIWIAQVAGGLAAAHAAGIVHRDIKSSNILLSPIDSLDSATASFQPKLADFGLAQTEQMDLRLTRSGYLTGTPAYASPEQVQSNEASPLSDIYSLGITLYEAISGELPFRGAPLAVIKQISEGELINPRRLNPNIPADLEVICLKAVNYRASQRYQTANEFAEDLNRWLEGKPILARPASSIEHAWRWTQRNQRVTALATTIFGLLLAIAIGGVLSALSISKAKNELAVQAAKAIKFSSEAQQASREAIAANQLAQQQRQLAVDSLNSLVEQVQTKLASRPGTVKLREELLRTAIAGLDRITSGEDQISIDHASINARIQMASLKFVLGDSEGAVEATEKVIGLASQRMDRNPEDPIALRDYARALGLRADAKKRVFANEEANQIYQAILGIYQRIRKNTPDDFLLQRECISIQQKLAETNMRLSQPELARVLYQSALDEIVAIKKHFPDKSELERDHYVSLTLLSGAHAALGRSDVIELQTQAIEIAERLSNQDPENTTYANDVANLLARVSRRELAQNNSANAILFSKRALEKYEQNAARDPNNLNAQMFVGTAWDALSQAYLNGEQLKQAEAAEIASFNKHVRAAELDSKSTLYLVLAMEAAERVSGLQFRQAKYPQTIEWSERSIEYLDKCRLREDYVPSTFDPLRKIYVAFLDSLRSLTLDGYKDSTTSSSPWIPLVGLSAESYICMQRGDHEGAFSLASRVLEAGKNSEAPTKSDLHFHFPTYCYVLAARSIAVSHRQVLQGDVGVETRTLLRSEDVAEKYKALALALLDCAMKNQPGLESSLRTEPDLAGLGAIVGR